MIYDLSKPLDRAKAKIRFAALWEKEKKIDLVEKTFRRTLSQNNYLHLVLRYYGVQVGLNLVEAKTDFKRMNVDIFNYEKHGEWYTRSTSELDKEEMIICLDRFIKEAETNGLLIPRPDQHEFIDEAMNEIEKAKNYL